MKPRAKCPVCGRTYELRGRAGSFFEFPYHWGLGADAKGHAPFVPLSAIHEWAERKRVRLAGNADELKALDAMLKRTNRAVAQHEEVVALRKRLGLPPV